MGKNENSGDPIITVKLRKGLADRQRLPLGHVLSVLEEFRQMMANVGRRIQRERGVTAPSSDFVLEILADSDGAYMNKGSLWSSLAITNNAETGILAAQEVIHTLNRLEADDGIPDPTVGFDKDLIRRVARVARIQRADRLELEVSVEGPGFSKPLVATFGAAGIASIRALQTPTFEIEGMSLFGKLIELLDRDPSDDEKKGFWGELRKETGETWRIQFRPSDIDLVTPLFRKQVVITGDAVYSRIATPKLIAKTIAADAERDYETAFDELFGCYRGAFSPQLLKSFREDD